MIEKKDSYEKDFDTGGIANTYRFHSLLGRQNKCVQDTSLAPNRPLTPAHTQKSDFRWI